MTPDQLTTLSLCCSVALLAVQACFVWHVRQELEALRHQRVTAADLRQLHAEIFVEHGDVELPDNFPREFAAITASMRKAASGIRESHRCAGVNYRLVHGASDDCNFCRTHDLGPQKSPSSVPAIQAQTRQVAAELEGSR